MLSTVFGRRLWTAGVAGTLFLGLVGVSPAQDEEAAEAFRSLGWRDGPLLAELGDRATVQVPEGYVFAGAEGAKKFLELTENIPSGDELGVLMPTSDDARWFAIFEFRDAGYIKDDEKDNLDADQLLASIKEGTEAANRTRQEKGWPTMEVLGWETAPFYDPATHNLTWAVQGRSQDSGVVSVNHSVRLLGRSGYMNVDLVLSQSEMESAVPQFSALLGSFDYTDGNRYAEFRAGDRVAAYGLTALVAGGAGAVAAKTGLLSKAWKLLVLLAVKAWKLVAVAAAAGAAGLRRLFGRREGTAA